MVITTKQISIIRKKGAHMKTFLKILAVIAAVIFLFYLIVLITAWI